MASKHLHRPPCCGPWSYSDQPSECGTWKSATHHNQQTSTVHQSHCTLGASQRGPDRTPQTLQRFVAGSDQIPLFQKLCCRHWIHLYAMEEIHQLELERRPTAQTYFVLRSWNTVTKSMRQKDAAFPSKPFLCEGPDIDLYVQNSFVLHDCCHIDIQHCHLQGSFRSTRMREQRKPLQRSVDFSFYQYFETTPLRACAWTRIQLQPTSVMEARKIWLMAQDYFCKNTETDWLLAWLFVGRTNKSESISNLFLIFATDFQFRI